MKKKIFIITGMILCILAGIVIVPSVIRTRQAVKEFEKDFHASANSGADSAGIDSEDEPAAENEEVSEEEEKKAFTGCIFTTWIILKRPFPLRKKAFRILRR